MKTQDIHKKLRSLFLNYDYKLENSFIYKWESDFFAISKSGYSIEVEIKVSKSDFMVDFKKEIVFEREWTKKHNLLQNIDTGFKPNKFYFAFPEGLINHDEIPGRYGIIEIGNHAKIVQKAKFLHKNKILDDKYFLKKLMNKFYWKTINQTQIIHSQKKIIEKLNEKIYDNNQRNKRI